jgi:hypothetical protein
MKPLLCIACITFASCSHPLKVDPADGMSLVLRILMMTIDGPKVHLPPL